MTRAAERAVAFAEWIVRHGRVLRVRTALPNFQDVAPDWIRLTDDDQWKLFWFVGYGVWDDPNCLRCPTTAAVLRAIPGLVTVRQGGTRAARGA